MNRERDADGPRSENPPASFDTASKGCEDVPRNSAPRGGISRTRSLPAALVGLTLLGVGVVSLASSFLEGSRVVAAKDMRSPVREDRTFLVREERDSLIREERASLVPKDATLRLTIPEMARIRRDAVPQAAPEDKGTLGRSAAIHLRGTGFPWQRGANVYLAGHRMGYPNTESWLTFWDLDELERGDRALLIDSSGTRYAYRVYKKFLVGPDAAWVTEPVAGKSVLTLQTCTLPDYSKRLIVRAELVGKRTENEVRRGR